MDMNTRFLRELDYGITVSIQALITVVGMVAENGMRLHRGEAPAYVEQHFQKVIEDLGIHHSGVLARWEGIL